MIFITAFIILPLLPLLRRCHFRFRCRLIRHAIIFRCFAIFSPPLLTPLPFFAYTLAAIDISFAIIAAIAGCRHYARHASLFSLLIFSHTPLSSFLRHFISFSFRHFSHITPSFRRQRQPFRHYFAAAGYAITPFFAAAISLPAAFAMLAIFRLPLIACHISFTLFRCHAMPLLLLLMPIYSFMPLLLSAPLFISICATTPYADCWLLRRAISPCRHFIPPCRHADAAFADAAAIFSFSIFAIFCRCFFAAAIADISLFAASPLIRFAIFFASHFRRHYAMPPFSLMPFFADFRCYHFSLFTRLPLRKRACAVTDADANAALGPHADALSPRHVKRAAASRTAPCRLPPRCRSALLDAAATLTASIHAFIFFTLIFITLSIRQIDTRYAKAAAASFVAASGRFHAGLARYGCR
jgi:hypothetical protein